MESRKIVLMNLFAGEQWRLRASQVALVVKNPLASAGDVRDMGLIPGLGRSPGGGKGSPLQYSSLENAMDYIELGLQRVRRD